MKRKEQIEAELHATAEVVAMWRGLMEHPGWKRYEKMVEEQVRLRQATICFTPLGSFGEALQQEFMKGEAAGIGLAVAIVTTQHEVAKLEHEKLSTQLEMETPGETQKSAFTPRAGNPDAFGSA